MSKVPSTGCNPFQRAFLPGPVEWASYENNILNLNLTSIDIKSCKDSQLKSRVQKERPNTYQRSVPYRLTSGYAASYSPSKARLNGNKPYTATRSLEVGFIHFKLCC